MLEAQDHLIGSLLQDRFLLVEQLGSGGMSTVYQAKDLLMDRLVAVKVLQQNSANSAKRFERECRALAAVKCQQVPEIFSWGVTPDGLPYLVMELVEGTTLAQKMAETPIAETSLCSIVVQVCDALTAIHAQGIVHRDLKPSNIMLVEVETELQAKVMDFGVVHLYEQQDALTGTADIIGSLHYLSPEHLTPRSLDHRSDLFSLGCIMYCVVSGHPPFETDDAMSSLRLLQTGERKAIPTRVPRYLATIINKCLSIDPNDRFQSAEELKHAILERIDVAGRSSDTPLAKSKKSTYLTLSSFGLIPILVLATQWNTVVAHWPGTKNTPSTFSSKDLHRLAQVKDPAKREEFLISHTPDTSNYADANSLEKELLSVMSNELHNRNFNNATLAVRHLQRVLDHSKTPGERKSAALLSTTCAFRAAGTYNKDVIDSSEKWLHFAHKSNSPLIKKSILLSLAITCIGANKASQADDYFIQGLRVPRSNDTKEIIADVTLLREWTLSLFWRRSDFEQQMKNMCDATTLLVSLTPPPDEPIPDIRQFTAALNEMPVGERSEKGFLKMSDLILSLSKAVTKQSEKIECLMYAGRLRAAYRKNEGADLIRRAMTMAEKQQLWPLYQQAVSNLLDAQCVPSKPAQVDLLLKVYSKLATQKDPNPGTLMLASFKLGRVYGEMDKVDEAIKYYQLSLEHAKGCRNRSNENYGPASKCPIMFEIAKFASLHGRTNLARECLAELELEDAEKLNSEFKKKLSADLPIIQERIKAGS